MVKCDPTGNIYPTRRKNKRKKRNTNKRNLMIVQLWVAFKATC